MKKKILRIIGIVMLLIVVMVVGAPFLLEAKIGDILKNNVNNNLNATLDFSKARLSLIRSFPSAEVELKDVALINKEPFKGDTLFASRNIALTMGLGELFKGTGESIGIKSLAVDGAQINIKIDEDGNATYDIGKQSDEVSENEEDSEGFKLDLQSYEISNSIVIYEDLTSGTKLVIADLEHKGRGDLSLAKSELDTNTEALVSFEMDSTKYLNENALKLDAVIGIDLEENTYTFLKNEAVVNQLPLIFEGFIKLNQENQEVDIKFKAPSSDFKNFLALIPETYSKNIENVQTTGECSVNGEFKGIVDDQHIPKFKIDIQSNNASFKYPDLPKVVQNINLDLGLHNLTGISEDTYVLVNKASFMIDDDTFNLRSKITDLLGNIKFNGHLDGVLDLAKLSNAYPMPDDLKLSGILKADISTAFDMASIAEKNYENTKTSGTFNINDFEYKSSEIRNPVNIKATTLTFNPSTVTLNELEGSTGQTDFKATGTIDNLLGFVFNDEKVEGNFNLNSDTFVVDDFMNDEVAPSSEGGQVTEEQLKIPSFLDCSLNATAGTVIYDNLNLKDVKGNLRIVDEKAILNNMTSALFNGKVSFDGEVSTKEDVPSFAMKLGMSQLGIDQSFKSLELFKVLAPVAGALRGKLNSDIELSGNLQNDFTPDLSTVSGKLLAELLSAQINADQAQVLSAIGSKLDFIDLDKLDVKGLKTALSFEDGTVKVKPFTMQYQDILIQIDGSHTFDKKLNYKATLDVPAKYLGKEVNTLIAKIEEKELENLTIPVIANIGGSYTSPEVSTDMTSGVKLLTNRLVEIQKEKLINKGKSKAGDLLGDIFSKGSSKTDSTSALEKDIEKEDIKGILGNVLGGNEEVRDSVSKKTDTTLSDQKADPIKEAAKNVLGGLLNRKKKKDSSKTENDSIN